MDLKAKISELTGLKYVYNTESMKGADILEPTGCFYKDVIVYDFKSFYPSIIMGYGVFGDKITDFLLKMYEKKNQGDPEAKIIMSSIYGQFKHFDIKKAALVTKLGRKLIRKLRLAIKTAGFNVIYSHTDSVMVSDISDPSKQLQLNNVIRSFTKWTKIQLLNNTPLKIEIEDKFKYIYFHKNGDVFAKNRYIGVNKDDTIKYLGVKPNEEELKMLDFIESKLITGTRLTNSKELMEYMSKYEKQTSVYENKHSFINLDRLTILEVEKQLVEL